MRLVVLEVPGLPQGASQVQEFELQPGPNRSVWIAGRQLGSDIHLVDPSVSRRHAEIMVRPDGLLVRDLGSSNGTFVNEQPLSVQAALLVKPGDHLRMGNVLTLVQDWPSIAVASNGERPAPPMIYPKRPGSNGHLVASSPPPRVQLGPTGPLMGHPAPPPPAEPPLAPVSNLPPVAPPVEMPLPSPPNGSTLPYNPAQPISFDEPAMPLPAPARPVRKKLPWLLALLGVLGLMIGAGVVTWLFLTNPTPPGSSSSPVTLPPDVFSSPASADTALGLNVAKPANWQRSDVGSEQVLYFRPDSPTTVLNLEKPPSRTIGDPTLSPEGALRQYLANVQANAAKAEITQEVRPTQLKDGTPASSTRLLFTTKTAPVVTEYTMVALSFRCGETLYFASAAAEGKNYAPEVKQDLDAAIANLTCIR